MKLDQDDHEGKRRIPAPKNSYTKMRSNQNHGTIKKRNLGFFQTYSIKVIIMFQFYNSQTEMHCIEH